MKEEKRVIRLVSKGEEKSGPKKKKTESSIWGQFHQSYHFPEMQ